MKKIRLLLGSLKAYLKENGELLAELERRVREEKGLVAMNAADAEASQKDESR